MLTLHAYDVTDARIDAPATHGAPADKTPTRYRVRLTDGRERRVYASVLGNGASLYVFRDGGKRHYLSTITSSALEAFRDGAPWSDALASVVASIGNAGLVDDELLRAYGRALVLAGFEVRYHDYGSGYLTYRDPATGFRGIFQSSEFEGWDHHMPIVPSRQNGSSMWHLDDDAPRWTVDAARATARESNRNPLVGSQRNAGDRYRETSGTPL